MMGLKHCCLCNHLKVVHNVLVSHQPSSAEEGADFRIVRRG